MAFEGDLGYDGSQPKDQDYTESATGIVSRTISLLTSKFVKYLIIVGIIGAACVIFSIVLVYALLGEIGILGSDPIGYLISLFFLTESPDMILVGVSIGFAIFAFLVNAIIGGAAIKFTLDEYGGTRGDIGTSFSHSLGRLLNITIVQIIITLMFAVVLTPSTFLLDNAMANIDISDPFNPIIGPGAFEMMMATLGLLFVGGLVLLYVQIRFAPTLAVVIDTDLSAIDSLKKSWELTSGNFMHVLASMLLMVIVTVVLDLIVSVFVGTLFGAVITPLFFGALSYIFTTVLYRDLASRKGEGGSNLPGYVM